MYSKVALLKNEGFTRTGPTCSEPMADQKRSRTGPSGPTADPLPDHFVRTLGGGGHGPLRRTTSGAVAGTNCLDRHKHTFCSEPSFSSTSCFSRHSHRGSRKLGARGVRSAADTRISTRFRGKLPIMEAWVHFGTTVRTASDHHCSPDPWGGPEVDRKRSRTDPKLPTSGSLPVRHRFGPASEHVWTTSGETLVEDTLKTTPR